MLKFALILLLFLIPMSSQASHRQNAEFDRLWGEYVQETNAAPIQENCKPREFEADPSVSYRGIVFLFHGYTACPQQFFELAQILSLQGWDVFLPLLPGHGRKWFSDNSDDLSAMVTIDHWQEYIQFADRMNQIAAAADGEKIIGGLSVGAAIALTASERDPSLYSKRILFSPFFDISNPFERYAVHLFLHNPQVGDWTLGWGPSCSVSDRQVGRAGTCSYQVRDVAAIQEFGRNLLGDLKQKEIKTQIVAVIHDNTVSSEDIQLAIDKLGASACFYPQGTDHSLISRLDGHAENKWWLPGLLKASADFISQGSPVPHSRTRICQSSRAEW